MVDTSIWLLAVTLTDMSAVKVIGESVFVNMLLIGVEPLNIQGMTLINCLKDWCTKVLKVEMTFLTRY